ncbi:hypothetical protein ZIOFF_008967 [Zingiber officinale]|uniref:Uncharacterized protein n=1 Tax=Zingiber officinale TaxID=94328 RepID=A0A8J5LNJ4_ZINOF|nr:hypothetical protein ZIOFF_008967 [Zingiber officinale]
MNSQGSQVTGVVGVVEATTVAAELAGSLEVVSGDSKVGGGGGSGSCGSSVIGGDFGGFEASNGSVIGGGQRAEARSKCRSQGTLSSEPPSQESLSKMKITSWWEELIKKKRRGNTCSLRAGTDNPLLNSTPPLPPLSIPILKFGILNFGIPTLGTPKLRTSHCCRKGASGTSASVRYNVSASAKYTTIEHHPTKCLCCCCCCCCRNGASGTRRCCHKGASSTSASVSYNISAFVKYSTTGQFGHQSNYGLILKFRIETYIGKAFMNYIEGITRPGHPLIVIIIDDKLGSIENPKFTSRFLSHNARSAVAQPPPHTAGLTPVDLSSLDVGLEQKPADSCRENVARPIAGAAPPSMRASQCR